MAEEEKTYCSMYSRNAELYHHGVKGMKWGVRKDSYYEPVGGPPKRKFLESKKNFKARQVSYNNQQILKNNERMLKEEKEEKEMLQKINDLDHKIEKIKSEHTSKILERNEELSRIADELLDIEMKPENESIFVYGIVPGGENKKHTFEDDMDIWYKTTSDGRRYKQLEDRFYSQLKIKANESLKKDTNYQMLLKKKHTLKNEMKKKNIHYSDYHDDYVNDYGY